MASSRLLVGREIPDLPAVAVGFENTSDDQC